MSVDSERGSSDTGVDGDSAPISGMPPDNSTDNPIARDSSPDLLRNRADSLLDEMMLGAVDVSVADNGRRPSSVNYSSGSNGSNPYPLVNGDHAPIHTDMNDQAAMQETSGAFNGGKDDISRSAFDTSNGDLGGLDNGSVTEQATPPAREWRVMSGGGSGNGGEGAWGEYVNSYSSSSDSSSQIQKWQPNSPADTSKPAGNGVVENHKQVSEPVQDGSSNSDANSSYGDAMAGTGYVSAMAVLSTGPRRSSLLPRMSRFDIDALNREIAELHEQIRDLLPVGHDQSERARHLLDKANTIAQSDPERSAEVEYYMQQVRTIVERTSQSRRWSNLYRDRLRTYLLAWTLLSLMTLTALWMSQFQIETMVAGITGAMSDAVFMRNFAGGLGAIMAGALGSAFGSLINMRRHARSQYGFFDRKYGLRGLMLPVIGALVGLIIYAIFAIVYYFAGINPSLSVIAMAIPAALAFVFGFSQESLYGTNG